MPKQPQQGDDFYTGDEKDYQPWSQTIRIDVVNKKYSDRVGWEITADDGCVYSCFWSKKIEMWCYWVDP